MSDPSLHLTVTTTTRRSFIATLPNCSFTNVGWSISQAPKPRIGDASLCARKGHSWVCYVPKFILRRFRFYSVCTLWRSRDALEPEDIEMELPDLPDCDLYSPLFLPTTTSELTPRTTTFTTRTATELPHHRAHHQPRFRKIPRSQRRLHTMLAL